MGRGWWLPLVVAVGLCAVGQLVALAQTPTRIDLAKNGDDVQITMSETLGPWRVVRSTTPQFNYQNVLLATAASSNPVVDANASRVPTLYFYDASDFGTGETSADDGEPSQENLYISSLVNNYGWESQSITINGAGFSPNITGNHVFFGSLPAVVTAATTTALTVTIPVGVMTGPVLVQVESLTSNTLTFTAVMESTYGGNAFQDISSIVFNDRTTYEGSSDHLFFTDMDTHNYLYEVNDDYTLTPHCFLNALKGVPMDASGNLYYANTTPTSNTGMVRKYTISATPTCANWYSMKFGSEGAGVSVSIVGLAVRSDGRVYGANQNDGSIRARQSDWVNAAHFIDTGTYTFDKYMGMAMDSTDTLYFTSGGTLYKTPTSGSASVSTVATGFTNASGIAIDESTANVLILIADRGAGNVWLLNAATGNKDLVTSGLTSPRAVAFGKDKVTGVAYYYVAEANRILRFPEPRFKFDGGISSGNVKVLISKLGPGGASDAYPCSLQSADGQIKIAFDVLGQVSTAFTVYLRVYDPPDVAPYVTGTNNDNLDPNKNGTKDTALQACLSPLQFQADSTHHHFEAMLSITNQYAGDNYQVGLSLDPNYLTNPSIKPMLTTGILTAWKRVYVERDKMFRQGGLLDHVYGSFPYSPDLGLTDDELALELSYQNLYCPSCGCTTLPCTGLSIPISVFDASHPLYQGYDQYRTITGLFLGSVLGRGVLIAQLDSPLAHTISGQTVTYTSGWTDPLYNKSAGIGVQVNPAFFSADMGATAGAFGDGFVEVSDQPDGRSALPYLTQSWFDYVWVNERDDLAYFSQIWSSHFNPTGASPPYQDEKHNHFHVMAGSVSNYFNGVSNRGYDYAYIMVQAIMAMSGTADEQRSMQRWTVDHELGHNLCVNACLTDGHDDRYAWCGPPQYNNCGLDGGAEELCVMSGTPLPFDDAKDGVYAFCLEDLLIGSPDTPCDGFTRPDTAMRTEPDPQ